VIAHIGRLPDAEQIAQQARIQEVEFRALDQTFGKVGKMRWQQMNDKTRLEDRNPLSRRGMGDPTVGGKGR
jgi:hypothetical protein